MAQPSSRDNMRVQFATWRKYIGTSKNKYPNCIGTFPDCPKEIDPKNPPDVCKRCPNYKK